MLCSVYHFNNDIDRWSLSDLLCKKHTEAYSRLIRKAEEVSPSMRAGEPVPIIMVVESTKAMDLWTD